MSSHELKDGSNGCFVCVRPANFKVLRSRCTGRQVISTETRASSILSSFEIRWPGAARYMLRYIIFYFGVCGENRTL